MIGDPANVAQPEQPEKAAARPSRILRRRWPYLAAVAATALVTSIITATSGHAASAQAAPPACVSGYLCLALSPSGTGDVALVTSGQTQEFPAQTGLPITEIVNNTTIYYCTSYKVSSGGTSTGEIAPGATQVVSESMLEVFPGPTCPA